MRLRRALAIWIGAAVLGGGATVSGQPPALEPPLPVFGERTEVEVVNLEVVVTDAAGNPVRGLTASDFEVLRDDAPVAISNFYAVEAGVSILPVRRAPQAPDTPLPPPGEAPATERVEDPDRRLNLILFVDQTNIAPSNRKRVLRTVNDFLDGLPQPHARVAVVTFDRKLNIRQPFTESLEAVRQVLAKIAREAPVGERFDVEVDRIRAGMEEDDLTSEFHLLQIRNYVERRLVQVRDTVGALTELVDAASGVAGPKSIVYVGDGMPLRPGEPLAELWSRRFQSELNLSLVSGGAGDDVSTEFNELLATANRSRVTFYPLYSALPGASRRGSAATTARIPETPNVYDANFETALDENAQEPMRRLADGTGGRFGPTPASWDGILTGVEDDFADLYSLGIPGVPGASPGASNNPRIEVRVKRDGLRLRYRRSLRQLAPDERISGRTLSALVFGGEENPIGITAHLRPERKEDDGTFTVTLTVQVPIGKLLLAAGPEAHEGRVSLFAAVRDKKGRSSPVVRFLCPVKIPKAQLEVARTRAIVCGTRLRMAEGEQVLAVSMRDDYSTDESTARVSIRLPPVTGTTP